MTEPSAVEIETLRSQVATLEQLLDLQEEQARQQFERVREQSAEIEARAQALAVSNARLESMSQFLHDIYKAVPGLLLVFDRHGVIRAVNAAAATLLEYSEEELVGTPVERIFERGEAPKLGEIDALASQNAVFRTEKVCVTKGGGRIPVLFSATMLGSAANASAGPQDVVCVALDIREQRRLETELRQAQKLESVGRLAAGIAHEINTPVQFVGDSVTFLRDASADLIGILEKYRTARTSESDGVQCMEAVKAAAAAETQADLPYLLENIPSAIDRALDGLERIASIVRAMKEFAHPDQKTMATVDLNHAIASMLVITRSEYKYVADLETDLGDLPPVMCHVGDMSQALLNLVVNAAHAIGDVVKGSDRKGQIKVSTRRDGDDVLVTISDTGCGIPESIRDRVFDPFFTTKAVGKGTGQGLAIARSVVVDRHRGTLILESEVGKGTTFFVRWPIHATSPTADAAGEELR
jgi:PAS domain S-box-containing protein